MWKCIWYCAVMDAQSLLKSIYVAALYLKKTKNVYVTKKNLNEITNLVLQEHPDQDRTRKVKNWYLCVEQRKAHAHQNNCYTKKT